MFARKATIVADLGFGDAGKGGIVDYLARRGNTAAIVRYNGGAQAAHNVVRPDGVHHTFSQFGSGTFVPGVRTHLSRFMLVDPTSMVAEASHLESIGLGNVFARLSVDQDALVVTPPQKAANRVREFLRGAGRHGSTGMGIGETMADMLAFPAHAVRAGDLRDPRTLREKFDFLQELKRDEFAGSLPALADDPYIGAEAKALLSGDAPGEWADTYWRIGQKFLITPGSYLGVLAGRADLIFEGAQGVLIDEWHGFHPYTTWSTATFDNAQTLLREVGYQDEVERLGVLRAYYTRHGPGPFPTEDAALTKLLPDAFNTTGKWQGGFRVGWFDTVMARYAIEVCGGVDALAVTNLDRFPGTLGRRLATGYRVAKNTLTKKERAAAMVGQDADPAFELIGRLHRKPLLTDLSYQETLTAILGKSTPVYKHSTRYADDGEYLRAIERDLRVPVTIASYGPSAAEKRARGLIKLNLAA